MGSDTVAALPLPVSWRECRERGWTSLDILLVSGDYYVDHPSFGLALVGRLLASEGYRVAVLAQPRYDSPIDFASFPSPRLFVGITAGNLDSVVANYTGNGRVRDRDDYSPGGKPWGGDTRSKAHRRRPDRATIVYANLARQTFDNVPIVLGGIEASLRRFCHYDFKQEKLRASILTDAKADILVYGMGERAITEIAHRCRAHRHLNGIAGTCQRCTDSELEPLLTSLSITGDQAPLILPSYNEVTATAKRFLEAELAIDRHSRSGVAIPVLQRQQSHWVVQHPPAPPLSPHELDRLYGLPFTRRPHPDGVRIPAGEMIRDSVTIVRGCCGNCSFCAIARHQGPDVVSRSNESIVKECASLAASGDFSGTISDLGGPSANLFGASCAIGGCRKHDCLFPDLCRHLRLDENRFLDLLATVTAVPGVDHVFISSGLRMGPLLKTPRLLRKILRDHTPGSLKIAPEHTVDELLQIMHKEPHALLRRFVTRCRQEAKTLGITPVTLTPYIITSHPGSTVSHVHQLLHDLHSLGLKLTAFQDFTPTPGTLSTAMYYSGLRADNRRPLPVPKTRAARNRERALVETLLRGNKKKRSRR